MASITRWDPFGEMTKMQHDMDRILSRMGTQTGQSGGQTPWMPRINIKQRGDDLVLDAELAGIRPEDVNLEVTDGVLSITGERKMETTREEEGGWMIQESGSGMFQRSIALPEGIDPNSIAAEFKDGMLEITVPKAMEFQKPQTTKIAIGGVTGGQQQQGQITEGQQTRQAMQGQTTQGQTTQGQTNQQAQQWTQQQGQQGQQGQQEQRYSQQGQQAQQQEGQRRQQAESETGRQQSAQGGQAQAEQGWVSSQGQREQDRQGQPTEPGQAERERERERHGVGSGWFHGSR